MKREKIKALCSLTIQEQEELFHAFLSTCKWNEIFYLWRPNLDDEGDDFLIELAVASNSSVIITDNILLLHTRIHIKILLKNRI